jgi:hypothetical protein
MTAPSSIDSAHFLLEQLTQASADLLRRMLTTFIHTLMSAEADAVCGAEYRARSEARTNVRNGYRSREFNTRAGTLAFAWRGSLQWSRHLWKDVPPTEVLRVFRSSRHRRRVGADLPAARYRGRSWRSCVRLRGAPACSLPVARRAGVAPCEAPRAPVCCADVQPAAVPWRGSGLGPACVIAARGAACCGDCPQPACRARVRW